MQHFHLHLSKHILEQKNSENMIGGKSIRTDPNSYFFPCPKIKERSNNAKSRLIHGLLEFNRFSHLLQGLKIDNNLIARLFYQGKNPGREKL